MALDFTELKAKAKEAKDKVVEKLKKTDLDSAMIGAVGGAFATGIAIGVSQMRDRKQRETYNKGFNAGTKYQFDYDEKVWADAVALSDADKKGVPGCFHE